MGDRITIQYHGIAASIGAWAALIGIRYYTLLSRIRRGWSPEAALETPVQRKDSGRKTHRATGSKEYRSWLGMKERCYRRGYWAYDRYGGRGISVCDRWQQSFESFLADVGLAPSPSHSLGRLDDDSNYEPTNVCWQTAKEQAQNRDKPRRRMPKSESAGIDIPDENELPQLASPA